MVKPHANRVMAVASSKSGIGKTKIIVNLAHSHTADGKDVSMKQTDRLLDVALDYMAHIPYDEHLQKVNKQQNAIIEALPGSRAGQAYRTMSKMVNNWPVHTSLGGHPETFVERLIQGSTLEVLP